MIESLRLGRSHDEFPQGVWAHERNGSQAWHLDLPCMTPVAGDDGWLYTTCRRQPDVDGVNTVVISKKSDYEWAVEQEHGMKSEPVNAEHVLLEGDVVYIAGHLQSNKFLGGPGLADSPWPTPRGDQSRSYARPAAIVSAMLFMSACPRSVPEVATPSAGGVAVDAAAIVAADDREPGDREADLLRKPIELLEFLRLEPGMKVADIGASYGHTTELLVRAVGPEGRVYGQNTTYMLDFFVRAAWTARLDKPINADVVSLEREFDDPFPDDIEPLDRVVSVIVYHDFGCGERARHNADVHAALRPGGTYVIVDSSGAEGLRGLSSRMLHRIPESLVVCELEAAGFELTRSADFLRNPGDNRDWNALTLEGYDQPLREEFSDKFVLEFTKPVAGRGRARRARGAERGDDSREYCGCSCEYTGPADGQTIGAWKLRRQRK